MSGLSSSRTPVTNVGITLAILSLLSASTICALQFSSPAYTVNEREGFVNVCLEANVSESDDNDTQPTVYVNVFTIPESAGKSMHSIYAWLIINYCIQISDVYICSMNSCRDVNVMAAMIMLSEVPGGLFPVRGVHEPFYSNNTNKNLVNCM